MAVPLTQIHEYLKTSVTFSIRWRGWWRVTEHGQHAFTLDADDGGYIRIDGDVVGCARQAVAHADIQ